MSDDMKLAASIVAPLVLVFICTATQAQDIALKPDALRGKRVIFETGGIAHYRSDGSYSFQRPNGITGPPGRWRVTADGGVCVNFENGRARCDHYVERNGALLIRDQRGRMYKVRFAQ
jgi:hypothetical protein